MTHSDHDTPRKTYEAPSMVVLGSVAELTALGSGPIDEAENDGSQA